MEYLIGSKEDFFDFVEGIGPEDKIGVLTHTDLDGLASAIFLEQILEKKGLKVEDVLFLKYVKGMFDPVFPEFKEKNITKIFLTDMNADSADLESFERLRAEFDCFLIDHHPVNPDLKNKANIIKTNSSDCSSLTLYNFMDEELKEEWKDIVCAAAISDFSFKKQENLDFINSIYSGVTLENAFDSEPGQIASTIGSGLTYYSSNKKKVYDLVLKRDLESLKEAREKVDEVIGGEIAKFRKEGEFYPEKNLYFYFSFPKFNITSIASTLVSKEEPEKTFVFVSGQGKYLKVSAKNQSGNEDMNQLVKKGIEGLDEATAGGHVPAAGARFLKKDLKKFKENILE
jgi:single-stranded DNA-specific DHH superfamily exonuclease